MDFLTTKRLRVVNTYLTVIIAVLALYIIVAPFWPQINWWATHDSLVRGILPSRLEVTIPAAAPEPTLNSDAAQPAQELLIPRIDLREEVHEGDIRALRKGIWRIPHSSTPDKGGNTVLAGHRFTYSGEAVLYHLDKVKTGDHLALNWHGKVYEYEVFATKVVPPTEVSIEASTEEPQLTIYTCTLLTAKERVVVQARLLEVR